VQNRTHLPLTAPLSFVSIRHGSPLTKPKMI
jgi:hypothetical protein